MSEGFYKPWRQCSIPTCTYTAQYVMEWHSLNQHGENPIVLPEGTRYVCTNFRHLFTLSHHKEWGGLPDEITDITTQMTNHPDILKRLAEARRIEEEEPSLLERFLETVSLPGQLELPFPQ